MVEAYRQCSRRVEETCRDSAVPDVDFAGLATSYRGITSVGAVALALMAVLLGLLFVMRGGSTQPAVDGVLLARNLVAVDTYGVQPVAVDPSAVAVPPARGVLVGGVAPSAVQPAEVPLPEEVPPSAAAVADSLYEPPVGEALPDVQFSAFYCSSTTCDTQRFLYQICLDLNMI